MPENKKQAKKEYHATWYKENKKTEIARALARQAKTRRVISEYKLANGCSSCGYNKSARALQFHHLGDKKHNISRMVAQGRAVSVIFAEIEKCIILCANCHAEIHDDEYISE